MMVPQVLGSIRQFAGGTLADWSPIDLCWRTVFLAT